MTTKLGQLLIKAAYDGMFKYDGWRGKGVKDWYRNASFNEYNLVRMREHQVPVMRFSCFSGDLDVVDLNIDKEEKEQLEAWWKENKVEMMREYDEYVKKETSLVYLDALEGIYK